MGLTIVTHTAGNRQDLLARCVASVESQLPHGAKHRIIQTSSFAQSRIDSLDFDDVVAFVDDDDLVVNDSLNQCYNLHLTENVGLVFTQEDEIDLNGNHLSSSNRASVTYQSLIASHLVAHHLAMFRTAFITETRAVWGRYESNVCWMIKNEAALKGGAIYAPFVGYQWRRHHGGMSVNLPFEETAIPLRKLMCTWLPQHFPKYVPKAVLPSLEN